MAHESALYRDDVEQVRRRWMEWRSTHAVRSRLPGELWAAAVELVERDGIDATARALDVDKPSLRKWAGRLTPTASQPARRKSQAKPRTSALPAFVELLAAGSGVGTGCRVEVESAKGAKLRLELTGMPTSELAELIRVFVTT
jgi:hypothetical protein